MKKIIENFNRAAEQYESQARPQTALAAALAEWVLPGERKGRALELGAGTGLFTRLMQPWPGMYLATDAAPKMVALGQARCPAAKWQVLDARNPHGIGPVNWIFACSLLQWLPEPLTALRSWRKILTSDGRLALAVLLPGTLDELQALLPEARPLDWHTIEEWRGMVECAGFAIEREQKWEQSSIHANSLELLRAVHAMGLAPHRTVTVSRLRKALHAYDEKHRTPGGIQATWQAWLVRAKASSSGAARP